MKPVAFREGIANGRHSRANDQNETRAIVTVGEILPDIVDRIIIDTAMLLSVALSVSTSALLF